LQVAHEILVVEGGKVQRWNGDIQSYKQHLKATNEALSKRKDLH